MGRRRGMSTSFMGASWILILIGAGAAGILLILWLVTRGGES